MREMRHWREYMLEVLRDTDEAESYLEFSRAEYHKDGDAWCYLLQLQGIIAAQSGNPSLVYRCQSEYRKAVQRC